MCELNVKMSVVIGNERVYTGNIDTDRGLDSSPNVGQTKKVKVHIKYSSLKDYFRYFL